MITKDALNVSPAVLRSFVAVADTQSFTMAGRHVGFQQSTISQHVRRLERAVGRQLVARDTHNVALTADGEAVADFARQILEANNRMVRFFSAGTERRRLRLGISEDFAMSGLAEVLTNFRDQNPNVDLELEIGLSGALYQRYDAGQLDLIFAKRKPKDRRGSIAWRERLAWIGRPGMILRSDEPVPLVAYAAPSITRSLAIETLESANRAWMISCSSGSLNGLRAALLAGLGVAAHSRRLMPAGLESLKIPELPTLPEVEFVALGPSRGNEPARKMLDMLVNPL